MTRVSDAFDASRAAGRAALVGYLPVGYPDVPGSIDALVAVATSGADVVEIGLPYTDPVMDGPTIQAAAQAALDGGVRTRDVFTAVEAVAATGLPAVVMTYWNLVEQYGVARFAADLANAGGAGLVTPDLLPEEADEWLAASDEHGLDRIFVVAPSSSDERLASTAAASRGFVYAASVMGVTGARTTPSAAAPALVERLRDVTKLPIGVGLGVSTPAQAAAVAEYADGVIVGSALVRCLLEAPNPVEGIRSARALAAALRHAL